MSNLEGFKYKRLVQFYETDPMGVVHHANYLRFYEEARVAWASERGLIDYQKPHSAAQFAVTATSVRHLKPVRFGDQIEIVLQVHRNGVQIIFEYKMHCPSRRQELVSVARTTHVPLNQHLQVVKIPADMKKILEKEKWTETWLSNL